MATPPESVEIYCLKCRAKTGSRDVEQVTLKNGRPALRAVCTVCGTRKVPHLLRRLNLGRLAGLRLHPSRVARQGAQLLHREMPRVASPAQAFSGLKEAESLGATFRKRRPASCLRLRKPDPEHGVALPGTVVAHRHGQRPVGFRQPRPASCPW